MQAASLDHTVWFHRRYRADEWLLYDQTSPSPPAARGLALGRLFTQDGRLVASVAQEGLIRPRRGRRGSLARDPAERHDRTRRRRLRFCSCGAPVTGVTTVTRLAPADREEPAVPVRRTACRGGCAGLVAGDGSRRSRWPRRRPLAQPAADQEMPFPCGQEWYGSTRSGHSPSWYSIDWNRPEDLGKPVVASGAGVVSRVENLGSRSYGLYVILDHGNGESTLYAHLQAEYVTVGQRVDQGELIGRLGESGGVTGAAPALRAARRTAAPAAWFHDEAFMFNTSLVSRNCVDTPVAGDWDGDGTDEVGVFRRGRGRRLRLDAGRHGVRRRGWGSAPTSPLVGDWDGDGTADLGSATRSTGQFSLQGADGPLPPVTFGQAGDRPVSRRLGRRRRDRPRACGARRVGRSCCARPTARVHEGVARRRRARCRSPATGTATAARTSALRPHGTWRCG